MVWKNPSGPLIAPNSDDPDYQAYLAWIDDGGVPDPDPSTISPHDRTYSNDPLQPLTE
jgi:hypothetical protein